MLLYKNSSLSVFMERKLYLLQVTTIPGIGNSDFLTAYVENNFG
jgi:hypothetical protein